MGMLATLISSVYLVSVSILLPRKKVVNVVRRWSSLPRSGGKCVVLRLTYTYVDLLVYLNVSYDVVKIFFLLNATS